MLTPEQKAARRTGIGASEAPILAGCDAYGRTPLWLYMEKMGMNADDEGSIAMRVGNYLEDGLLNLYVSELQLDPKGLKRGLGQIRGKAPMFCSPDAVLFMPNGKAINVQVKCVGTHMLRHWGRGTDASSVPDYVQAQVQWEMEVLDVDETHVVALLGGTDFRVFTVEREKEIGAEFQKRAEAFWGDYIALKRSPEMDGTDAGDRFLELMFPRRPEDPPMPLSLDELPESAAAAILKSAEDAVRAKAVKAKAELIYERSKQVMQLHMEQKNSVKGRGEDFQFSASISFQRGKIDWRAYALKLGGDDSDAEMYRPAAKSQFRLNTAKKEQSDAANPIVDPLDLLEQELEGL